MSYAFCHLTSHLFGPLWEKFSTLSGLSHEELYHDGYTDKPRDCFCSTNDDGTPMEHPRTGALSDFGFRQNPEVVEFIIAAVIAAAEDDEFVDNFVRKVMMKEEGNPNQLELDFS